MNKQEPNNEHIKKMFEVLDKNEMVEERQSLEILINSWNDDVDNTIKDMNKIFENITELESNYISYMDYLFLAVFLYSIFSFIGTKDVFGLIYLSSVSVLWSLREKIINNFFVWKE